MLPQPRLARPAFSILNLVAWPTAILIMATAMWFDPGAADPMLVSKETAVWIPAVACGAAIAVLLVATVRRVDRAATVLAAVALLLVMLRGISELRHETAARVRSEEGLQASEVQYRQVADDQAALRRVATLVAAGAPQEEVFSAVTVEVGQLLGVDFASTSRYHPDGAVTVVGAWARSGVPPEFPNGIQIPAGGANMHARVFQTSRPARFDAFVEDLSPATVHALDAGAHASVGVPITVEGQLWGVIIVSSKQGDPLPADTEARLAGFTQLTATAIANAKARSELSEFADEQAALRRVATLVAQGAAPGELLAAVTGEVGRLLGVDFATMSRYHPDGAVTVVGVWSRSGAPPYFPIGTQLPAGGANLHAQVFQTARPARFDTMVEDLGAAFRACARRGPPCIGRRADHRRRSVVGHYHRVFQTGGTVAGRDRGAAGRIYRADRYRHRQRRGPGGPKRLTSAHRGHR